MNRVLISLAILMVPLIGLAQNESPGTRSPSGDSAPYQPAVPAPNTYNSNGGWGGYSGGGTVAGSAMNGMANMMNAAGQRNLANSAAAVNMTQAQKNEIENRQQWTNTYFEMRRVNQQQAAAARGPAPTMEQLARYAKEGAPRPLQASQMDNVSGQLRWPSALQQPCFESERKEIDQLFATRANYGGLGYSDQMKVRKNVKTMVNELKSQIDQIPQQDYVACKSFLRSVDYAGSKADVQE
jgi:hypothetical protein